MFKKNALNSAILAASMAVGLSMAPKASACSCGAIIAGQAAATSAQIAGMVGQGAITIAQAMTRGFLEVNSTLNGSTAQQTAQLVNALEQFTTVVATELRAMPVQEQQIENKLNQYSPARQATTPCTYSDRAADMSASTTLASLQQAQLNSASSSYNDMTSAYPVTSDTDGRFYAQTAKLLRTRPDVKDAGYKLVAPEKTLGALSAEEVQEASTFINLTTNPSPPARVAEPTTSADLARNAQVDIYNMRMSLPQSVQNQLLAYESPVMTLPEGSWLEEMAMRASAEAGADAQAGPTTVSFNDLLELMATHRLKDPMWQTALASKDTQGLLKDLAYIEADASLLDFEIWKQERNAALMMAQFQAAQLRQASGE
ncbi:hypothetical protein [Marinobacter sp. MBR-105]|jgi:hypothetical protein